MILYPNLLKHRNVNTINSFWNLILERVSIGDAPFGTKIVNDQLHFKKKFLDLYESNAEEVIEFFKENVGLQLQYVYFSSWKEIKRKIIKDNLIQDYVTRFQKENELNNTQANYLSSMIHLYITLKKITHKDIILDTDPYTHIISIKGIIYNKSSELILFEPHIVEEEVEDEEDDE